MAYIGLCAVLFKSVQCDLHTGAAALLSKTKHERFPKADSKLALFEDC